MKQFSNDNGSEVHTFRSNGIVITKPTKVVEITFPPMSEEEAQELLKYLQEIIDEEEKEKETE